MTTRSSQNNPISILGAGSWGTALALLLARNQQTVLLWSYDKTQADDMEKTRCNKIYLPNHIFPKNISITSDLKKACDWSTDIFIVVPSIAFRSTILNCKPYLKKNARIAWGSKGIDAESKQLFHHVVAECLSPNTPMAVLSGPSFANDVASGLPTAVTLASNNSDFSDDLIQHFCNDTFRIYKNDDMNGVELCGVIKNVMAIATGLCDGLKLGDNARSALITRGIQEMQRLCLAMGGSANTVMGLAGLGDLILTCTGNQSRNRRLGLALGAGKNLKSAQDEIGQAVEGLNNVKLVYELARENKVDMPICEKVYDIIHHGLSAKEAAKALLERDIKYE